MSDPMTGWKEEYTAEVNNLTTIVSSIDNPKVGKTEPKLVKIRLEEAEQCIHRIKEVKKSFGLELRLVKDRNIKLSFEEAAKSLDARVTSLLKEIRSIKLVFIF